MPTKKGWHCRITELSNRRTLGHLQGALCISRPSKEKGSALLTSLQTLFETIQCGCIEQDGETKVAVTPILLVGATDNGASNIWTNAKGELQIQCLPKQELPGMTWKQIKAHAKAPFTPPSSPKQNTDGLRSKDLQPLGSSQITMAEPFTNIKSPISTANKLEGAALALAQYFLLKCTLATEDKDVMTSEMPNPDQDNMNAAMEQLGLIDTEAEAEARYRAGSWQGAQDALDQLGENVDHVALARLPNFETLPTQGCSSSLHNRYQFSFHVGTYIQQRGTGPQECKVYCGIHEWDTSKKATRMDFFAPETLLEGDSETLAKHATLNHPLNAPKLTYNEKLAIMKYYFLIAAARARQGLLKGFKLHSAIPFNKSFVQTLWRACKKLPVVPENKLPPHMSPPPSKPKAGPSLGQQRPMGSNAPRTGAAGLSKTRLNRPRDADTKATDDPGRQARGDARVTKKRKARKPKINTKLAKILR